MRGPGTTPRAIAILRSTSAYIAPSGSRSRTAVKPYISATRALAAASIARYGALCFNKIASYTPGPTSSLRNTWVWASISPGSTVALPRSTTRAPGFLAARSAAAPSATILSPSTSTATPSRGRSDTPSITCAALIRMGDARPGELTSKQARANLHMAGMLAPSAADCAVGRRFRRAHEAGCCDSNGLDRVEGMGRRSARPGLNRPGAQLDLDRLQGTLV